MSVTRSSEPSVQHREGPDLDALVEQIAAEHPVPVRFIDVDRVRRGGVLGFFAKEQYALSYQVADEPVDLDDLVGTADAADIGPGGETSRRAIDPPATADAADRTDTRFADLLLRLAAESAAGEVPDSAPEPSESARPALERPTTAGRHHADHEPFEPWHGPGSTTTSRPLQPAPAPRHLALDAAVPEPTPAVVTTPAAVQVPVPAFRAQPAALGALGVPDRWGTDDEVDPAGIEHLTGVAAAVLALPPAPVLPNAPGEVVVLLTDGRGVGGPAVQLLSSLLPGGTVVAHDRATVVRAMATLRAADAPGLLVVDAAHAAVPEATIAAGQPELVVLAVEATGKTLDHRRRLAAAGGVGLRIDALSVERAGETSSPATVWELDVPVLVVDGRLSDVGTWLGLLLAAPGLD